MLFKSIILIVILLKQLHLNTYKIENYNKKTYYQKNKEKIIEKIKEYNKNYVKTPEQIKEYNKRAYEKRKAKKLEEQNLEK